MEKYTQQKHQCTINAASHISTQKLHIRAILANEMAFLMLLSVALSNELKAPLFYTAVSQLPAFLFSVFYLMRTLLKDWDFNSAPFFYSMNAVSPYLLSLASALSMIMNITSLTLSNTTTLLTLAIAKLSCEHLFSLFSTSLILNIEHPQMVVISSIPSLAAIILTFAFTHDSDLQSQFGRVALGTLMKHLSLAYHRKSQILHAYNRNRLEWMVTRLRCLADQEEEAEPDGTYKKAFVKVDSWLFKRAVLVREEAKLLAKIEDAVKEGLQREGLTIKIQREDRLKFLQDIQKTHAQSNAHRMMTASGEVDRKKTKLEWGRIEKLLSENSIFAYSNEAVCKLLAWEMQVIHHKIMAIDNRPDFFNDFEGGDYDEVDLKKARKTLRKAQNSDRLSLKDLLNQMDWGKYTDPPEGQVKDLTNKPHEKIVIEILHQYSNRLGQYQHIVPSCDVDGDEFDRMKIDLIMDGSRPIYHKKWVGISSSDQIRMHALVNLLRLPILLIASVMSKESFDYSFEGLSSPSLIPLILLPLIAVTLGLTDLHTHAIFMQESNHEALELIDALPGFIYPMISLLLLEEDFINASHMTSLFLAGTSTIIAMVFYRYNHTSSCSQSTIELVKCSLKHDSLHGLEETDTRLNLVLKFHGPAALNRISFDTLLSQNKAQLNHSSPSNIQVRELFDVYFKSRSAMWSNLRP